MVGPVDESEAEVDFLGEITTGNLHLLDQVSAEGDVSVLGLSHLTDIVDVPYDSLKGAQKGILTDIGVPQSYPEGLPHRAIFCSRTLNLRSIQAIGYDMDYTLIHYDVNAWEGKAYAYGLKYLKDVGCPVDGLTFDANLVIRGLIVDKDNGNVLKVDRFGYVKRAMHGTRIMSWGEVRQVYGRELINLRHESRFVFLNTLFSVSEGVMYMQMTDRLDQGLISPQVVQQSYQDLWRLVSKALFRTHVEGQLKAEIIQDPASYVEQDPDMAQTLLDQREAGKILMLITNSDYEYTNKMMSYAYNPFLPPGMKWRDLFDMVIVQARKPDFFNHAMSLYEVVTEDGLMKPCMTAVKGGLYCGGSARMVEVALGVSGDEILYVGDHLYTDAALAKINFRWRTALVVRELEHEINALALGRPHRAKLKELMNKKELVGDVFNQLRLMRQRWQESGPEGAPARPFQRADVSRLQNGHGEAGNGHTTTPQLPIGDAQHAMTRQGIDSTMAQLLMIMETLDTYIGPMLEQDGKHFSRRWGYLSRAGLNDKSQFTRQIEKYADIYTSRVANFLRYTPYMYFRSPSQSLAHDRNLSEYYRQRYGNINGSLDQDDEDEGKDEHTLEELQFPHSDGDYSGFH